MGGIIDYYLKADDVNDLVQTVGLAQSLEVPFVVLGNASQTVVSDYGFSGLVIQNQTSRITPYMDRVQLLVDSGVSWHQAAFASANFGLGGLESTLGLLGTIGGAWATGRLAGDLTHIRSYISGYTVLEEDGSITTRTKYVPPGTIFPILLVVHFQLLRRRRDEILRRIREHESARRAIEASNQSWIGPVFAGIESQYIQELFERSGVFKRRPGGVGFSKSRPNYLEVDRETTARAIRDYISEVASILLSVGNLPLAVNIHFLGKW